MGHYQLRENDKGLGFLNLLYYLYRRNNWMLDPTRAFRSFDQVPIDRPIFLLGTQGGGLTLVSRMLRRNQNVVSVTGNSEYWAGADEMQIVLEPILPPELAGIGYVKVPPDDVFGKPRGWVYATDRLIGQYRNTASDVTPEIQERFKAILRWLIKRHSTSNNPRFTDKSQLYTIKVSFIASILQGLDPKFLLVTRNPYAVCYRAAKKSLFLDELRERFDFSQLLALSTQHWANSMRFALRDGEEVKSFKVVRFEDVLKSPMKKLREICEFAELAYSDDMVPQPDHQVPFGSRRQDRWYPLRPDVNEKYLSDMKQEHVEIIAEKCGEYAGLFGYERPLD